MNIPTIYCTPENVRYQKTFTWECCGKWHAGLLPLGRSVEGGGGMHLRLSILEFTQSTVLYDNSGNNIAAFCWPRNQKAIVIVLCIMKLPSRKRSWIAVKESLPSFSLVFLALWNRSVKGCHCELKWVSMSGHDCRKMGWSGTIDWVSQMAALLVFLDAKET